MKTNFTAATLLLSVVPLAASAVELPQKYVITTELAEMVAKEAIAECKRLCAAGFFVGPSSGANMLAARAVKRDNPEIENVLTFLCDRGEKYLSMMFP